MSSAQDEPIEIRINQLAAKVESLSFGLKATALAALQLFSVFNVGDTLAVSYFRGLFMGALAGRPMPMMTTFLLAHQALFTFVALVWPVLGVLAIFFLKRVSSTMIAISALTILVVLQFAFNWVALLTPLINLADQIN